MHAKNDCIAMTNDVWIGKVNDQLSSQGEFLTISTSFLLGFIITAFIMFIKLSDGLQYGHKIGLASVALAIVIMGISIISFLYQSYDRHKKTELLLMILCRWETFTEEEKDMFNWSEYIKERTLIKSIIIVLPSLFVGIGLSMLCFMLV